MLPNIVLVGFMGCGKSSVGRRISTNTGHRFIDTDEIIIAKEGRPITEIFADRGEAYFRDLETAALQDLTTETGIVLATGGGLVLREENRAILRKIGPVVWLDAEPDLLFDRVSRNKKRPLLQTDKPRETFDRLLEARRPIYEASTDFRVDSTGMSHEDVADIVVGRIKQFFPGDSAPV